jgi:putative transposase
VPRRPDRGCGGVVFHALNRAIQNTTIFVEREDYLWFLRLLDSYATELDLPLLSYCVMPNHWHLVVWPQSDGALSECMKQVAGNHALLWREARGTQGRGAVYQGRFKAIAVQSDGHLLMLFRYVERNPVRARLVARAEDWAWSSASPAAACSDRPHLAPWPIPKPSNWLDYLNEPCYDGNLKAIREAIRRNRHYGDDTWRESVCRQLGWRSGRGRGRPGGSRVRATADDSVIGFDPEKQTAPTTFQL